MARSRLRAIFRVALSLLGAGISYVLWMGAFILSAEADNRVVEVVRWMSAPVVTALGFAAGVAVAELLTKSIRTKFLRILPWPLIGCAIGAAVVYPFGPMLIVFGMFAAGTAGVVVREVALRRRREDRTK